MPTKVNTRKIRHEITRKTILDEAMSMLIKEGFDGLTINKLAKQVGYTPGALYSYFSSRDALIAELQGQIFALFAADYAASSRALSVQLSAPKVKGETAVLAELINLASTYIGFAHDHSAQHAFLSRMIGDPKPLVADTAASAALTTAVPLIQQIVGIFARAVKDEALRSEEPIALAIIYISAIQGVLQTKKIVRFLPGEVEVSKLALDSAITLLRGWGANKKKLKQAVELVVGG